MLAIIPARKGSKRLPNKNMMPLLGKPLIQYTLTVANNAPSISRTIISSDIKNLKLEGNYDLISRPKELAEDDIPSKSVIIHVLNWIEEKPKTVILLQPTSPLRTSDDIENAFKMYMNHGNLVSLFEACPSLYKRNGAIYIMRTVDILENNVQFTSLYLMPKERSIDIDTMEDFKEAERILNERNRL